MNESNKQMILQDIDIAEPIGKFTTLNNAIIKKRKKVLEKAGKNNPKENGNNNKK